MELNKDSNKQYMEDKKNFEFKLAKLEKGMEKFKEDLKLNRRQIEDAEIRKKRAEEDKQPQAVKTEEENIKKLKAEQKEIKTKGKVIEDILNNAQDKVQEHFKEIEKDPELKAHIDKTMAIKYKKQLNKVHKEQAQLETLRNVMEEKPELENNLKGMIRANEKIESLKKELKGLDEIKDKARIDEINLKEIPEAESKYKVNKDLMMKRVNEGQKSDADKDENRTEITSEFIDTLAKEGFSHYKADGKDFKKGDINLNKSLNKIAKGYAKKEDFYNRSLQKVIENNPKSIKGILKAVKGKFAGNKTENETSLVVVNEKVSWLHPIKKFKSWWNNRKENDEKTNNEENKNEMPKKNNSEKFKTAYKYDIVKDYVQNREEDIRAEVKNERKNDLNGEKDSGEEEISR